LKQLQQQVLSGILEKVPPHPAVHGFVKGRSVRTCVSLHSGKAVVLRLDLKDFFPSFSAARIQTMFRTFGYPERVADVLGGICTNFVPTAVLAREKFDSSIGLQVRQWAPLLSAAFTAGSPDVSAGSEHLFLPPRLPSGGTG
jgi:hypothetical protein